MATPDDQLPLFDTEKSETLVCAFLEPWQGAHLKCQAFADDLHAKFLQDVKDGKYDANGYTAGDLKRKARNGSPK